MLDERDLSDGQHLPNKQAQHFPEHPLGDWLCPRDIGEEEGDVGEERSIAKNFLAAMEGARGEANRGDTVSGHGREEWLSRISCFANYVIAENLVAEHRVASLGRV